MLLWSDVGVQRNLPYLFTDALFRAIPNWYIRGAMHPDTWAAVAQAGPRGTCQVTNPSGYVWDSGEVAHGTMPVAIAAIPTGYQVTWMTTIGLPGSIAHRINLDFDLVPTSGIWDVATTTVRGSSEGFLDSFADQPPICTQTVSPRVFVGQKLWLWTQRGPWVLGQTDAYIGLMAVNVDTGVVYQVAVGPDQTPSHLALMDDGSPIAVMANTAALLPFLGWKVWTGPTPPDPPIPPIPPDPPVPPIPPIPPEPPVIVHPSILLEYTMSILDQKKAPEVLLASRIQKSPEWPNTHCVYLLRDGWWLSISDNGDLSEQPHALSGETFFYTKGDKFITAVRGSRAFQLLVAANQ